MYPENVRKDSGPHHFGYIQSVSLHPTIVTMWTEADLRLCFDMAPSFFTRQEKLPEKVFNDTGPILYYSMVVSHPTPGKSPIAIAEMFSSSHAVPTLTNFLMNFCRDVMKLHRGHPANPAHLEIDFSWASLHSWNSILIGAGGLLILKRREMILRKEQYISAQVIQCIPFPGN